MDLQHYELRGAARKRLLARPSTSSGCTAAWYFSFYPYFVFALYERKNEIQKKIKYRSAEGSIADCVSRVNMTMRHLRNF
jgi:hypothetical protein